MNDSAPLVLAVDPGKMTGYAIWCEGSIWTAHQLPRFEFISRAESFLAAYRPGDVDVVIEKFTITSQTAKKSPQPDALKITGAIEYFSEKFGHGEVTYQAPSSVMKLIDNDVLKGFGWYRPGQEHANDALRHVAARLAGVRRITAREILDARTIRTIR